MTKNQFSWDLLFPAYLIPAQCWHRSLWQIFLLSQGLQLTYLLCKETDVAWWGVLTSCLLFCQLLQFCCYHTRAVTFALRSSVFCIFVHPGWAHMLSTWTAMAQTYQTNIWSCLVSSIIKIKPFYDSEVPSNSSSSNPQHGQGCLPLDCVAQSPILEHFQERGINNLSEQAVLVFNHPHSKEFLP